MAHIAHAFDRKSGSVPLQAANEPAYSSDDIAYMRTHPGELPPMMLQFRLADGRWTSFSYSDIREIVCRDAGHIQLTVSAMSPLTITIEGRNLRELASMLGIGAVRWVRERDPRSVAKPDEDSEVVLIVIEPVVAE